MRKIYLQLTPFFPTPERFYGPYIYDQVKAIERKGEYEVIVIKFHSLYRKIESESYIYQGIRVYNFKTLDLPSTILPGLFHPLNLWRLERLITQKIGIDFDRIAYIHAHTVYPGGALATSLAKKYAIPSLIQHHGFDIFQALNVGLLKGRLKEWNIEWMRRRFLQILNSADLNIGVSRKVLDTLRATPGFSGKALYVLYNGVDPKKFFKTERSEKPDHFTIGCIGNFFEIKDQITLLKAVHLLIERGIEDILVRFIGSGPTREECDAYIRRHGLESHVRFEPEIDHTKLNDFYNALDLFVLPSYYEAFGCVYTEAMQTGVPIIAVESQGIEEVLHEKEKPLSLIPAHDYRRLADLIEFRYNNRSKVDYNFDIDNYIQDFLNYLETNFSRKSP